MEFKSGKVENVGIEKAFHGVYQGKKVLITGITGFKGSWLLAVLNKLGAEVYGYALPPKSKDDHYHFVSPAKETLFANILDQKALEDFFQKQSPDIIFHLAAQPLVKYGYENPIETYEVNVMGSLRVYEAARKTKSVKAIVSATTDKVYQNLERSQGYHEDDRLGGHDPYSSSKACVEIMSESYRSSFLEKNAYLLATARAGNVIGGGDWAECRLIPDVMRSYKKSEKVTIRNPNSIRPWQHVLDPLSGYLLLGQELLEKNARVATAFNFGPPLDESITVLEMMKVFKEKSSKFDFEIEPNLPGFHETGILKLDCSKSFQKLGWKPTFNLNEAVTCTVEWYQSFIEAKQVQTENQIDHYFRLAASRSAAWIG